MIQGHLIHFKNKDAVLLREQLDLLLLGLRGAIYFKELSNKYPYTKASEINFMKSCFMDQAILNWCKLFGKFRNNKTHWKMLFDPKYIFINYALSAIGIYQEDIFFERLITYCQISKERFELYRENVLGPRDQYIAHREPDPMILKETKFPPLTVMIDSILFFYHDILLKLTEQINLYFAEKGEQRIKLKIKRCTNEELVSLITEEARRVVNNGRDIKSMVE